MIYVFLKLETRDGEREYNHLSVHELPKGTDITAWANDYLKDFWGEGERLADDEYEFHGGEIITSVYSVQEITKSEYTTLNKYL